MTDNSHRIFQCAVCAKMFIADAARDQECENEFVRRYGHRPEDTTDDEVVSVCDGCNAEFDRRRHADQHAQQETQT
jgi:hypothetical protein